VIFKSTAFLAVDLFPEFFRKKCHLQMHCIPKIFYF